MKTLKAIRRGMGYVPGYGPHPGTGVLIFLVVIGALAGIDKGLLGITIGAGASLLIFGPMYLSGAYGRGKESE